MRNTIFKKLCVAFQYEKAQLKELFFKGGYEPSKSELKGWGLGHGASNYRVLDEQPFRAFLNGMAENEDSLARFLVKSILLYYNTGNDLTEVLPALDELIAIMRDGARLGSNSVTSL